jgi:hypothetical protein
MKRVPRSGLYWLTGPAIAIALLAGCTQPPKTGAAKSPSPQPSAKAPSVRPQAAAPEKPSPAVAHRPASVAPVSEKAKLVAKKRGPAAQSADPGGKPDVGPKAAAPAAGTADATKKAGCCAAGAKAVDLTPPPPDQPQPKLVCKQTKIVSEPIWQGKEGVFKFTISNEGEAPLAIRVKPT